MCGSSCVPDERGVVVRTKATSFTLQQARRIPLSYVSGARLPRLMNFGINSRGGVFVQKIKIFKRRVGLCVFFSFFVPFYSLYWLYLIVKNTKAIKNDNRRCLGELLCILLVPFYSIYWWYTRSKFLKTDYLRLKFYTSKSEYLYLFLSVFKLDIVCMAIMQKDFNDLPYASESSNQTGVQILKALIMTSIFAAMSIVLGKFLQIPIGDSIRISFENLPIMLASFMFGPIFGGACGLVADLLGCVLRGYAIIPLITVASCLMGIIPGVMTRYVFRKSTTFFIIASGFISHIICSMTVKTIALHRVYGMYYALLIPTRVLVYTVTGLAEAYICSLLLSRNVIKREIIRM